MVFSQAALAIGPILAADSGKNLEIINHITPPIIVISNKMYPKHL
ncbi:putative secreted protein [Candidatus Phytoplasma asteris]|uniref:Secreted protein n=1 Tax=Candidatus Phytoplasma asteris TaxID=85620 RepID=A0ABZ3CDR0_9MOLU